MKRLVFFLAASALASPAVAQHGHHDNHPSSTEIAEDPHAGHRPAEPDLHAGHAAHEPGPHADHRSPDNTGPDPHAGHDVPAQQEPEDPHAGHDPGATEGQHDEHAGHGASAEPEADPHAGHRLDDGAQKDPHAGHDVTHTAVAPPVAPPGPEAFTGPEHAADVYFGEAAMARARADMYRMHGAVPAYRVLVDRLEAQVRDGPNSYLLDAQAWYGGDIDKLWLKAEAHGEFGGKFEGAELQALWSRAITPFFDFQTGVRFDARSGPNRGYLVLGVQGLAPYWIELEAATFLSDKGDVTARIELEHDARITQRLILQPRVEAQFSLQDIPAERIGSGLSEISVGVRLRYHITQLFAPYVGLEYQSAVGDTRHFRRLGDEHLGGLGVVVGFRFWF